MYRRHESRRNQVRSHPQLKNTTAPRRAAVWSLGSSRVGGIKIPLVKSGVSVTRRTVFGRRCDHHTKRMLQDTTEIAMDRIADNPAGGCRGCRTPVAPPAATLSAGVQAFSLLFSGGVAGVAGESATIAPRACACTCACTYSGLRSAATPATPGGSRGRFWRHSPSGPRPGRRGCLPPQPRHPRHPVAPGGGRYV